MIHLFQQRVFETLIQESTKSAPVSVNGFRKHSTKVFQYIFNLLVKRDTYQSSINEKTYLGDKEHVDNVDKIYCIGRTYVAKSEYRWWILTHFDNPGINTQVNTKECELVDREAQFVALFA
jgi:hypothetical protein